MSQDTERIPVPTNGTGRTSPAATGAGTPGTPGTPVMPGTERRGAPPGVVPRDQTVAFTPNQLAAGFGIVAGLLLLFVGARRRRGRK